MIRAMAKGKSDDKDPKKSAKDEDKPEAKEARADDKLDDKLKADDKEKETAPEPEPVPVVASRHEPPPANGEPEPIELLPPRAIDTSVAPLTPAPAPGRAPRGDARSLRRGEEFCVIYRLKSHLIRRQGKVGTIGEWSITEYPNQASAAHAYAQECSELTDDGFVDIR